MSDDFDRDALKRLVSEVGATIKIKTGAGKIVELLPEHLDDNQKISDMLAPKVDPLKKSTKDNHDKIHNDTHDKTTSTHDKGAKRTDDLIDSPNGVLIEGIKEHHIQDFKDAAKEIIKGRDLFIRTKD